MHLRLGPWVLPCMAALSCLARGAIPASGSPQGYFDNPVATPNTSQHLEPRGNPYRPQVTECYLWRKDCYRYPTTPLTVRWHIDQLCNMDKFMNAVLGPDTDPEDFPYHSHDPIPSWEIDNVMENSRYMLKVRWLKDCMISNGVDGVKQRVVQPLSGSNNTCWSVVNQVEELCPHNRFHEDTREYWAIRGGKATIGCLEYDLHMVNSNCLAVRNRYRKKKADGCDPRWKEDGDCGCHDKDEVLDWPGIEEEDCS